jgi:hypothetical protein
LLLSLPLHHCMMERNVIYSSLYIVMHASREVARMLLHAEYR